MGGNMRALFVLLCISSVTLGAPQGFGLGDIINGISDAVSGGSEYDEPPYTLVATHNVGSNSFEERQYAGGKNWACNKMVINSENSDRGMFMKLFRYISGSNVGGNKIKMTIPVSMRMKKLSENSFEKEMCFYLAENLDAMMPKKDSRLRLNIFTLTGTTDQCSFGI